MLPTVNISNLIDSQLPQFITEDYPAFSKLISAYYRSLERQGEVYDLTKNFLGYKDIDNEEYARLVSTCVLRQNIIEDSANIDITVDSTQGFPEKYGLIKIDNEIFLYESKTNTQFKNCLRGATGTSTLGTLYVAEKTYTSEPAAHLIDSKVVNLNNLFLYSLLKNFEIEYTQGFKGKAVKITSSKTFVKRIKDFYQTKGNIQSYDFIFNAIFGEKIDVYYPKENIFKSSESGWQNEQTYAIQVVSGDIYKLIGLPLEQLPNAFDTSVERASFIVDNVIPIKFEGGNNYSVVAAVNSLTGVLKVTPRTTLMEDLPASAGSGDPINVFSTIGFPLNNGKVTINGEEIIYSSKTLNQFIIRERGTIPIKHDAGNNVYSTNILQGTYVDETTGQTQTVVARIFGVVSNIRATNSIPYLDNQISLPLKSPGFETNDVIANKWKLNPTGVAKSAAFDPNNATLVNITSKAISDVTSVFRDDENYYVYSSGFPSYEIGPFILKFPEDNKHLKKFPFVPKTDGVKYPVKQGEIGLLVNGVPLYSNVSTNYVYNGGISSIQVTNEGSGYTTPPVVLISGNATAKAVLVGGRVNEILITNAGFGYTQVTDVTITSGRNATATAVVNNGRITNIVVNNPGEYYTQAPIVKITDTNGNGNGASYLAQVNSVSKTITGFVKISEGSGYSSSTVKIEIISPGNGASALAHPVKWNNNLYFEISSGLDVSGGYTFTTAMGTVTYGHLSNPFALREQLSDNVDSQGSELFAGIHSPILGWAYDGNPIYGPYAYSNPLDPASTVTRIRSSYSRNGTRPSGPSTGTYPLGSFVEDFNYVPRSGDLDENNGRFCITPDFPNGRYCYFITIESNGTPAYPYVIGKYYENVPAEVNFGSKATYEYLPSQVDRLKTSLITQTGTSLDIEIGEINTGSVTELEVQQSVSNHSVGDEIYFDNGGTNGFGASASVSRVKGVSVTSLEYAYPNKIIEVITDKNVFIGKGKILTQNSTNATGVLFNDVAFANRLILTNVSGSFNLTDVINTNDNVLDIQLSNIVTFSAGISIVQGTIGDPNYAEGTLLESVFGQKNIKIRVNTGVFTTSGTVSGIVGGQNTQDRQVENIVNLSDGFKLTSINANVAKLTTSSNHRLIETDTINVSTIPNDTLTTTTYLTRARRYQTVELYPLYEVISFGKESFNILNSEINYTNHPFQNGDAVVYKRNNSQIINYTFATAAVNTAYSLEDNGVYYVRAINENKFVLHTERDGAIQNYDKIEFLSFGSDLDTHTLELKKIAYLEDTGIGKLQVLNSGESYVPGTYNNVELVFSNQNLTTPTTGAVGLPGNAKANIVVDANGNISSIQIIETSKGYGYSIGTLLTIDPSSQNAPQQNNPSFPRAVFKILHVGFSNTNTLIKLKNNSKVGVFPTDNFVLNDKIQIGTETVTVTGIDRNARTLTVSRGSANTTATDHFNETVVTLFEPDYTLSFNTQIQTTTNENFFIKSKTGNKLEVVYGINYSAAFLTAQKIFQDNNNRNVKIRIAEAERLEYEFKNITVSNIEANWNYTNKITLIPKYKYVFDLSDNSLTNTTLEFFNNSERTSKLLTVYQNNIAPGINGAYVVIKLGLGLLKDANTLITSNIPEIPESVFYSEKNYLIGANNAENLFDVVSNAYDGEKTVIYAENNSIFYSLPSNPPKEGFTSISYTTTSVNAIGLIDKIDIVDGGFNYTKVPIIEGIVLSGINAASLTCTVNPTTKKISSINIISPGFGYSNPRIIVIDQSGSGAEFNILKTPTNGIGQVQIINGGQEYSSTPNIIVLETDNKVYAYGSSIGSLKTFNLLSGGVGFTTDYTLKPQITTPAILILQNVNYDSFVSGEEISQLNAQGVQIATGIITSWRNGSNIVRVEILSGEFQSGFNISGKTKYNTALVKEVLVSDFIADVDTKSDSVGTFFSDKGKLNVGSTKLQDGQVYQDYSYIIRSNISINDWREYIKKNIHPAGFVYFGELLLDAFGSALLPKTITTPTRTIDNGSATLVSVINLWDPEKNKVIVQHKSIKTTISSVSTNQVKKRRGQGAIGSVSAKTPDLEITNLSLQQQIDGTRTTFTLIDGSTNAPFIIQNENELIVTVDNVPQIPLKSYRVFPNSSTIVFTSAPKMYTDPVSGEIIRQSFGAISRRFVDITLNATKLQKVRNYREERNFTATIIRENISWLIEESISWFDQNNPSFVYPDRNKCKRDLSFILTAFADDILGEGTEKTMEVLKSYIQFDDVTGVPLGSILFIANEKAQTISIINKCRDIINSVISTNTAPSTTYQSTIAFKPVTWLFDKTQTPVLTGNQTQVTSIVSTFVNYLNNPLNFGIKSSPTAFIANKIFPLNIDNSTTEFDIDIDINKNTTLLVYVDGVIQEPDTAFTITPNFEIDDTPKIGVSSAKIKFAEPPKKFRSSQNNLTTDVHIFTHGNYFKLDDISVLFDETTGRNIFKLTRSGVAVNAPGPESLLVVLDGVIQKPNLSYIISADTIVFSVPPRQGSKCFILNYYGLDAGRAFSAFNTETELYDKEVQISLSAPLVNTSIENIFYCYVKSYTYNGQTYTANSYQESFAKGFVATEVRNVNSTNGNIEISSIFLNRVIGNEYLFTNAEIAFVIDPYSFGYAFTATTTSATSAKNADLREIVYPKKWGTLNNNIAAGDRILIDGESEPRTVLYAPSEASLLSNSTADPTTSFNLREYQEVINLSQTSSSSKGFGASAQVVIDRVIFLDNIATALQTDFVNGTIIRQYSVENNTTSPIIFQAVIKNDYLSKRAVSVYTTAIDGASYSVTETTPFKQNYRTYISSTNRYFVSQKSLKEAGVNLIIPNKRDLQNFFNNNSDEILLDTINSEKYPPGSTYYNDLQNVPQPQSYNYETTPLIVFRNKEKRDSINPSVILLPPTGGGAVANAVISGGELIDVEVVKTGAGYLVPPEVLFVRGFDILKQSPLYRRQFTISNQNSISYSKQYSSFDPNIPNPISVNITAILAGLNQIGSIVTVRDVKSKVGPQSPIVKYIKNIQVPSEVRIEKLPTKLVDILTPKVANSKLMEVDFDMQTMVWTSGAEIKLVKLINAETISVDKIYATGIIDKYYAFYPSAERFNVVYTEGSLGYTLKTFENIKFTQSEKPSHTDSYGRVINLGVPQTIGYFSNLYPNLKIEDFDIRSGSVYGTNETSRFRSNYASDITIMTKLGQNLVDGSNPSFTISSTILVSSDKGLPAGGGKLLLADTQNNSIEEITYTSALNNTLFGCTRSASTARAFNFATTTIRLLV